MSQTATIASFKNGVGRLSTGLQVHASALKGWPPEVTPQVGETVQYEADGSGGCSRCWPLDPGAGGGPLLSEVRPQRPERS